MQGLGRGKKGEAPFFPMIDFIDPEKQDTSFDKRKLSLMTSPQPPAFHTIKKCIELPPLQTNMSTPEKVRWIRVANLPASFIATASIFSPTCKCHPMLTMTGLTLDEMPRLKGKTKRPNCLQMKQCMFIPTSIYPLLRLPSF